MVKWFGFGTVFMTKGAGAASLAVKKVGLSFSRVRNQLQKFGLTSEKQWMALARGMSSVGKKMMIAGGVMLAATYPAVKAYGAFQKDFTELKLVSGASDEAAARLKKLAVHLGIVTEYSPKEAVQGMYELASAGLNVDQIAKSINSVMLFSTASKGVVNLGKSSALIVSIMKKFNIEAKDSERIVDQLVATTKKSMFHFREYEFFIRALGQAPLLGGGLKLSQALALGGALRNVGATAAQSGFMIRGFLYQLNILERFAQRAATGEKLGAGKRGGGLRLKAIYEAYAKAGEYAGKKVVGKVDIMKLLFKPVKTKEGMRMVRRNVYNVLQDLVKTFDILGMHGEKSIKKYGMTITKEQSKMLQAFPSLQAQALLITLSKARMDVVTETGKTIRLSGLEAVKYMDKFIKKSHGMAAEYRKKMLKTFWGMTKLLKGSMETAFILIGKPVVEFLIPVMNKLYAVLNKFIDWAQKHTVALKILVGVWLGLGAAMLGAGAALTIIGMGIPMIISLTSSVKWLNVTIHNSAMLMKIFGREAMIANMKAAAGMGVYIGLIIVAYALLMKWLKKYQEMKMAQVAEKYKGGLSEMASMQTAKFRKETAGMDKKSAEYKAAQEKYAKKMKIISGAMGVNLEEVTGPKLSALAKQQQAINPVLKRLLEIAGKNQQNTKQIAQNTAPKPEIYERFSLARAFRSAETAIGSGRTIKTNAGGGENYNIEVNFDNKMNVNSELDIDTLHKKVKDTVVGALKEIHKERILRGSYAVA